MQVCHVELNYSASECVRGIVRSQPLFKRFIIIQACGQTYCLAETTHRMEGCVYCRPSFRLIGASETSVGKNCTRGAHVRSEARITGNSLVKVKFSVQ